MECGILAESGGAWLSQALVQPYQPGDTRVRWNLLGMGIRLTKGIENAEAAKQNKNSRCARFGGEKVDIPPSETQVIAAATVIQNRKVMEEALRVAWVEKELNDLRPERLRRSDKIRLTHPRMMQAFRSAGCYVNNMPRTQKDLKFVCSVWRRYLNDDNLSHRQGEWIADITRRIDGYLGE